MNELSLPASTGTLRLQEANQADGWVCTVLDPRLEARNAYAFKRYLQERLKNVSGKFWLDLSKVDFVDSSGLGAILGGLKAAPRPETLVLVGPAPNVRDLLRVTRTEKLFVVAARVGESPASPA